MYIWFQNEDDDEIFIFPSVSSTGLGKSNPQQQIPLMPRIKSTYCQDALREGKKEEINNKTLPFNQ